MFYSAQSGHWALIQPPVDVAAGGVTSDIFTLRNYAHASIIIQVGATGAASTVTVEECDDFVPTMATAIGFDYYSETNAGGDTLGAKQTATASGFATTAADNTFYVIEIDGRVLTDGFPNLRVKMSDPGAVPMLCSIAVVLSGARYAEDQNATALA